MLSGRDLIFFLLLDFFKNVNSYIKTKQIKTNKEILKKMPDYSKGQIYSIRFFDNDKLIYIGSTIQPLAVRFGGHKRNIRCSLYHYIQENFNGDFKMCYIELIENFECNNRNELDKREGELIRQYKADNNYIVINKNIAGRTNKEYQQDNVDKIKEYKKEYRQINADIIKEIKRQHYKDNADKFKEYQNEYYLYNADKIKEYQNEYKQINADKIREQNKKYRQRNADKIREKRKQYYLRKKVEAKEQNI